MVDKNINSKHISARIIVHIHYKYSEVLHDQTIECYAYCNIRDFHTNQILSCNRNKCDRGLSWTLLSDLVYPLVQSNETFLCIMDMCFYFWHFYSPYPLAFIHKEVKPGTRPLRIVFLRMLWLLYPILFCWLKIQ